MLQYTLGVIELNKDKLQNILCVILPIVFIGVLAAGLFKGKSDKEELTKLKNQYEASINTSAKPEEGSKEEETDSSSEEKVEEKVFNFEEKAILFLGDGVSVDGKYQGIAAEELKLKNYINGARSGLMLGEMDDEVSAESLKDIDIVVILGGTNDYSKGKALGTISDTYEVDTFYGNVQGIIDNLKAMKEGLEIVFLTPLKHGYLEGQPSYPNTNYNGDYLDDYVNAIIEVCKKNDVKFIDMFKESGINENNVGEYTLNNIILNEAGHNLVGSSIAKNLKGLFQQ